MQKRRKLTKAERQQVYDKCAGHCAYCGCELAYKDMQVDHVIPLRRGGEDIIDNMLPACRSCNHYKHTFKPEDFRRYIEEIPNRLLRDNIPYQVGVRFGIIRPEQEVKFWYEKEGRKDEQKNFM